MAIGNRYKGPQGVYICVGHDQYGYIMRDVDTAEVRSISERAIDRTYLRVRMSYGAWKYLARWNELGRKPPSDEYVPELEASIRIKLRDNGLLRDDALTPAGVALLPDAHRLDHVNYLEELDGSNR